MDRRAFMAGTSAAALGAAFTSVPVLAQTAGDAAVATEMEQVFNWQMQLSPLSMTSLGIDTGPFADKRSQLDQTGPAVEEASARLARQSLARLAAIDEAGLSETWRLRRAVTQYMLDQSLVSEPLRVQHVGAPYRLSQQGGAYFSIPDFLNSQHPVDTAADADAYLARLAAFPFLIDDESTAQAADAARGVAAPGWSLDLVDAQIGALLAPAPGESGMVTSLATRAGEKGLAGDWAGRAERIVRDGVYPALERQRALVRRMRRTTRAGDGVWRIPHGDEIYAKALAYYTTTSMSPDEVHRTGLAQVAEISAELDTILKGAGLTRGSVGERLNALNTRPDQLYPNTDAGRAELLESLNTGMARITALLPQAFDSLPTQPLEIRRVPVDIQDGAPNGYYSTATLDGSRPAIYWINLKSTGDWPKYTLPSLTYHEGNPGHHLHLSLLQEQADLPLLLKNYWLSAYGEGWALYAEQVAEELGAYSGLEKAGALQSWLFRAARLVVDTGVHHQRWSRERATQYFVDTVAFTRERSQREIERYCVSPGQACSYKVGQNVWVALRERAERELGDRFRLGAFHELIKLGVMPLDMLGEQVDTWIAREKGR
ncbi:DUF885 family protein [Altererythrobacter buctensis]|uniref:DUF885 family protein n=1 Tax=Alteraurantiacibacter buctensis TaxID=1503981 RepID=A0A844YY98_9SPHN|nr:DUF885 family protein [Alteraurantiacibacter buctensis]